MSVCTTRYLTHFIFLRAHVLSLLCLHKENVELHFLKKKTLHTELMFEFGKKMGGIYTIFR